MSLGALAISTVDGRASPVNARDGAIMSVMRHLSPDCSHYIRSSFGKIKFISLKLFPELNNNNKKM